MKAARRCRARDRERAEHFKALLPTLDLLRDELAATRVQLADERTRLLLKLARDPRLAAAPASKAN